MSTAPDWDPGSGPGQRAWFSARVNGQLREDEVAPRLVLSDYLRGTLGLTAASTGCDTANCGACTVSMNDHSVKSCTVLAVQADRTEIVTLEGMRPQDLRPLQHAFHEHHALQCGYCTPGMLMAAHDLIRQNPDPTREEIRLALKGNLCRCTGYETIVAAVLDAAGRMRCARQAEEETHRKAPPADPPTPGR